MNKNYIFFLLFTPLLLAINFEENKELKYAIMQNKINNYTNIYKQLVLSSNDVLEIYRLSANCDANKIFSYTYNSSKIMPPEETDWIAANRGSINILKFFMISSSYWPCIK